MLFRSQSVFCLPILKQGQVIGVLYLEHRQVSDIFTDNHKTVISFLCTQAAIALENARLYQEAQVAAEKVRTEQSYLAALLDNIPHLAWLRDADSRFIAVNQPFATSCGCEPIDIIGKQSLDQMPAELVQKYRDDDLLVMASGKRQVVEEIMINAKGEDRWLEIIKTPMHNREGKVSGTVGIALDITDRKQMEITLRASEERYAQMVSNVPGTLYQFEITADGKYRMNYVSCRFAELFELSAAAVIANISVQIGRAHV